MSANVSRAKVAQSKATVLAGNEVSNKKEDSVAPVILLPSASVTQAETVVKVEPKPEEKTELKEKKRPERLFPTTKKRLSIDELTDKADRVYLLRQKYQEVREKRKQLESFTISHDKNNAQLTLIDAKGLSIETSNPVAIGKLLGDWMSDLNSHLAKTESEIRAELEILNDN